MCKNIESAQLADEVLPNHDHPFFRALKHVLLDIIEREGLMFIAAHHQGVIEIMSLAKLGNFEQRVTNGRPTILPACVLNVYLLSAQL